MSLSQYPKCENCRFAGPEINFHEHECRRHAPFAASRADNPRQYESKFPVVMDDGWCGDHEITGGLAVVPTTVHPALLHQLEWGIEAAEGEGHHEYHQREWEALIAAARGPLTANA